MNIGNFQSLRLDCQISDHVREGETTRQASDRVYALVENELTMKLQQAKDELS